MADNALAAAPLPPTGERFLTPPLGEAGARLVLQGVFTFRYSGMRFDAQYRTGADGVFSRRHPYLQWSPRAPLLESEDVAQHRYQFRIPPEWRLHGQSIGLRIDLDRLVDEFLIPPSEVRHTLTGEMVLRLLPLPVATIDPWPAIVGSSVPAALMFGGLGWILRRRTALMGLPLDIQRQLERIVRKQRAAFAAVGSGLPHYQRLGEELKAVEGSAWGLAQRIRRLREVRSRIDLTSLVVQSGCLEQELARLTDTTTREVRETALGERRKALSLIAEIERTEARCGMQLATLEATLDTVYLTLKTLQPTGPTGPSVETVRRELQAEIAAIAESEFPNLETRRLS